MRFSMGMMWGCLAVLAVVAIIAAAGASGAFAIPCVLMMGVMMWMMMRGMGGHSSPSAGADGTAPSAKAPTVHDLDERLVTSERPMEILERRFAAGEISMEEYRTRREALANGAAQPSGAHKDELLTAPGGEGRR
jgi:hypothetical protein